MLTRVDVCYLIIISSFKVEECLGCLWLDQLRHSCRSSSCPQSKLHLDANTQSPAIYNIHIHVRHKLRNTNKHPGFPKLLWPL